ncbi:hypothetical protein TrVE_jg12613 [Triparma verrucosa]|uniref:EamA domain-containing protein n=1 Tax=Triparma verrucosa TaxID=1606542 RepID=A0A9W7EWA6_9STRA|nr:hypothetical protein TrVE_jg12613 [Triparma verrucosa]
MIPVLRNSKSSLVAVSRNVPKIDLLQFSRSRQALVGVPSCLKNSPNPPPDDLRTSNPTVKPSRPPTRLFSLLLPLLDKKISPLKEPLTFDATSSPALSDLTQRVKLATQNEAVNQPFDPLGLSDIVEEEVKEVKFVDSKNFSRLLVMIAAALYGTNFATVKILDSTLPIATCCALRFTLAAVAVSPFLFTPSPTSSKSSPSPILSGLEIGAWNAAGYLSQAVGLSTTPASKSAFICSLAVIVVPILDLIFEGKKLNQKSTIGCILAVLGVMLLEGTDISLQSSDLATFFQPVAFGFGFWRMEKAMKIHKNEALKLTAAQLVAIAGVSVGYMVGGGGGEGLPDFESVKEWLTTPAILGSLLWTGVVTTAFTVWLETLALKNLSAAETTLLFSTEPIWGSLFAAAVMGEVFGVKGYAGAGVILLSCLYSSGGLDGIISKDSEKESVEYVSGMKQTDQLLRTKPNSIVTTTGGLVATTVVSDLQANIDLDGAISTVETFEATVAEEVAGVAGVLPDLAETAIKITAESI